MAVAKWEDGEGPRQKLLARGVEALSDAELLAVLLRTGVRGCSALQLARSLLCQFDGLGGVFRADKSRLLDNPGVGEVKYAQLCVSLEMARRLALETISSADILSSPQHTRRFLQLHLGARRREVFSSSFWTASTG